MYFRPGAKILDLFRSKNLILNSCANDLIFSVLHDLQYIYYILNKGAFTNYVCIFWHLTTYVPPLVCTFYVVNIAFF